MNTDGILQLWASLGVITLEIEQVLLQGLGSCVSMGLEILVAIWYF